VRWSQLVEIRDQIAWQGDPGNKAQPAQKLEKPVVRLLIASRLGSREANAQSSVIALLQISFHRVEDTGVPRYEEDGTFAGFMGSAIDVSARKRNVFAQDDDALRMVFALTERERQVLVLIAEGKSTKEAAAQLGISYKTADSHRSPRGGTVLRQSSAPHLRNPPLIELKVPLCLRVSRLVRRPRRSNQSGRHFRGFGPSFWY
jgi:hypothetical protein